MGKQSDKPHRIIVSDPINLQDGEKVVTFYRVTTIFANKEKGQHQLSIHHRFSDFRDMHSSIEEYYARDPILKKLPSPPPKAISLFGFGVDHTNPDFIDNRVNLLNEYMNALKDVAKVTSNDIFLGFLGYFNDGKECSVATKKDPMIQFAELDKSVKGGFRCLVGGFKRGPSDEKGPIEITELVKLNDLIVRVNCENIEGMKYKEVVKLCKPPKGDYIIIWFSGQHSYSPVIDLPTDVKKRKKHRKVESSDEDDEEDEEDEEDDDDSDHAPKKGKKNKKLVSSDEDEDDDYKKKKPKKPMDKKKTKKHIDEDDDDLDDNDEDIPQAKHKSHKKSKHVNDDDDDDDDLADKKKKSKHVSSHHKSKGHRKAADGDDDDDDDDLSDDNKKRKHKKESKPTKSQKETKSKEKNIPPPPSTSSKSKAKELSDSDSDEGIPIEEDENLVV